MIKREDWQQFPLDLAIVVEIIGLVFVGLSFQTFNQAKIFTAVGALVLWNVVWGLICLWVWKRDIEQAATDAQTKERQLAAIKRYGVALIALFTAIRTDSLANEIDSRLAEVAKIADLVPLCSLDREVNEALNALDRQIKASGFAVNVQTHRQTGGYTQVTLWVHYFAGKRTYFGRLEVVSS
jgi:hypothetical protein